MLQGLAPPQLGGRGYIYAAHALVTPAAYSATAQAGPLLWNGSAAGGSKGVTAYLLFMGWGLTVASTVAGSLGVAGGSGQSAAPTGTTAITQVGNMTLGQSAPQCSVYNAGTVAAASSFYLPCGSIGTGATTVQTTDDNLVHIDGAIIIPPGCWASAAASAALTGATLDIGWVWLEVAND